MQNFNFGLLGEYIVILIYKLKLYQILQHRMRNFAGEIDIIALRAKTLVFIEVKSRSKGINDEILSYRQQERIRKAAEIFLSQNNKYYNYKVRFDLVIIQPYKLPMIIQNAW